MQVNHFQTVILFLALLITTQLNFNSDTIPLSDVGSMLLDKIHWLLYNSTIFVTTIMIIMIVRTSREAELSQYNRTNLVQRN